MIKLTSRNLENMINYKWQGLLRGASSAIVEKVEIAGHRYSLNQVLIKGCEHKLTGYILCIMADKCAEKGLDIIGAMS